MDGSRVLRKRKTSSAEADENIMALRKRRKNAADDQSNDEAATRQDGSSRPVSRSLRLKIPNPPASIVERSDGTVLVKMRVNSSELRQILSRKPRPRKRSGRSGRRARRAEASRAPAVPLAPIATPFTSTAYSQPFYSLYDKETDELKGKPYGGILTEAEADTSKTMPTNEDRRRFDEAKQKAEEEWRERLLRAQSEVDVPAKRPRKASGPASQIECIQFGDYEIDTWYAAPYPEEYSRNRVLFICEFCLKYMNSDYVAWRHKLKCPAKHPPGDEIYRHGSVSVFEVDGRKNPVYCQNLCLLAKLFLGSKTLYYDVEPFLFYVLCEYNDLGYHFVGYFSKEKRASSQNNVSCILTLPIHQRKGYGNLLIDFSYLLTRVEKKTGSPEKPLSDMGLVSYRNYWRLVMCRYLLQQFPDGKPGKHGLSIRKISDDTGLTPDDVISALEGLRCLVRDPQTQLYAFRVDLQYCREYVAKWEAKNYVQLNESALTWTPYVMGRSSATNFELGPALTAIAPREEEEEQKPVVAAGESLANGTESSHQPDTPDQEVKDTADTMVLESTEPNDAGSAVNGDSKPNGILVNGNSIEQNDQPKPEQETAKITGENWIMQYKDIPPTRFEVWPPITGSRRGDRSRGYIPRPPVVRTGDSASKPRPRRSAGSRRSTAARPKTSSSSSSKRKPGGTGRGPGRWPKGTKKSDYGNADSGPGFPPGWIAERARVAVLAAVKKEGNKENGGSDVKDTVQVQSPTVKEASKAQRGKENADVDMQDADGHAEDE
jgi:histone acetyltransferase SAS3